MYTKQVAAAGSSRCGTFNRGTDCHRAALAWCSTAGKAARVLECASQRDLHQPVVVEVGGTTMLIQHTEAGSMQCTLHGTISLL